MGNGLDARDGFPPTTADAFDDTLDGVADSFFTKLNATETDLIYSTYLKRKDS